MKKSILKCSKCGTYTMRDVCPKCNENAKNPKPAKFSIDDKYGSYRRKAKEESLVKEGLI